MDYDFLVKLATACLGGGGSNEGEVQVDDGTGIEDITDEKLEALKQALGDDFYTLYPDLA